MYAHKKLLIAVIVISVFVTLFSLTIYLTNVAQRSHAMSKDDIVALNQKLRDEAMQNVQQKLPSARVPSAAPKKSAIPLELSLSTNKTSLKAGKNSANIDKAIITLNYKNNTSEKITGAKLSVTVGSKESSKFDYGAFAMPPMKANAAGDATFEMYLPDPGTSQVRAELITAQGKKFLASPLSITAK